MEVQSTVDIDELRTELVRSLRANRWNVTNAVALAFETIPRWKQLAEAQRLGRDAYLVTHFQVFVDYLIEFFERDDSTFKHLFVGESIKALYDSELADVASVAQTGHVAAQLRRQIEPVLRSAMSTGAWAALDAELAAIERTLTVNTPKTQRVLLVGDCLFLDIVPFMVADLLDAGIRLLPDYVTSKNPAELRDQLRTMSARKFDIVFVSPFSYEFSTEYAHLSEWRQALTSDVEISEVVGNTWNETRQTLDLLADLFDCPIHVHNSAAVVRDESAAKRYVKLKATARVRGRARQQMNALLASHLRERNASSYQHLFLFDEDRMVREYGDLQAGAYFYRTELQHPAMLGRILAREYVDLVYVNAWLLKKKVVVCDLDNTLWDGVIGEGEVRHFHDHQRALKALKSKGVVLAINSKNDPANVHWRGGTLSDDDFVCAAVSWEPKIHGMKRIQTALNLKIKDYVFIDDREDERELIRMTYPDILCLDATSAATWRRFALWEHALEDDPEMDRTLMYKQREARKAFVKDEVSSDEERQRLYASLDLKLAISRARPNDLKRVAELINRTNQFNLEGSRTTFKEVSDWHASPVHVILLGRTSDRFGDMGTTCVVVVRCDEHEMRLMPFVLSCRVFGYGIERSMMNYLKRLAQRRGLQRIVGRYVSTPQNSPCSAFLADNGFVESNGLWSLGTEGDAPPDPDWLSVTDHQ